MKTYIRHLDSGANRTFCDLESDVVRMTQTEAAGPHNIGVEVELAYGEELYLVGKTTICLYNGLASASYDNQDGETISGFTDDPVILASLLADWARPESEDSCRREIAVMEREAAIEYCRKRGVPSPPDWY